MTTMTFEPARLAKQWMQFTANRAFAANPVVITEAKGIHYVDQHGRRILDGSSGLYCCPLGHGRPEIAEAMARQALLCDYAPPFSMASDRSFELAERVSELLPEGFNKVFFTNSGSDAVDTAMKLAVSWHAAVGEPRRTRFVSRERAYHGVNVGGISLNGMPRNRNPFEAVCLTNVSFMRHTWTVPGQPGAAPGTELADDLARICDLHGAGNIAACFVEPVAGSTGVLVPPAGYLERLREICTATGVLLVFDEVITGFHRLNAPFGSHAFGVVPDIITMAKAISNGVVPMGAVAIADHVWDRLAEAPPEAAVEFVHGYTTGGHPVVCAAAIEVQKIYADPDLQNNVARLTKCLHREVLALKNEARVTDVRTCGLMAGIDVTPRGVTGSGGAALQAALVSKGLFTKCSGDTVTLAPPFVANEADVATMVALIRDVIRAI